MAFCLSPYSATSFNATPQLSEALEKHAKVGGNEWVQSAFGELFQKHGVEKLLGISLLHHHFPLADNEYLTEVNGTSTAWKSHGGTRPHVWSFSAKDKLLRPMEFAMDDDDSTVEYPDWESAHIQNFLTELAEMILKSGADGVYGLARYPGDGFPGRTEITVGRANVNLTPKQAAKYDWSGGQSEAAWYYEGGFYKRSCGCACLSHHTSESHHQHYVPSTFEG